MGAWYVMSAIGLFEVDGGAATRPIYEIGSPIFDRVTVHLDPKYYGGKTFVIETIGNSEKNVYVQSATLNGEPLRKPWFHHSELVKGGKLVLLVLRMGPKPNKEWGSRPEEAPPSMTPRGSRKR
jgi:putative alpha-1,2-mannosidase